MTKLQAAVAGRTADFFRAYATVALPRQLRSKSDPSRTKMSTYDAEDPILEASVTGTTIVVDAGQTVISKVAFYRHQGEDQVCVGSVDVGLVGPVEIELVEPEDVSPDDFE